jgi:hypothetical protein
MYVIYVDECGYHPSWAQEDALREQPVHVVSAVAIASEDVKSVYTAIRDGVSGLGVHKIDTNFDPNALGKGREIKAKDVDRGYGFWCRNPQLRDKVREIYLGQSPVTYFVVCIDKARHSDKYVHPEEPADLALRFLLERIQGFLEGEKEQGLVIFDANRKLEEQQRKFVTGLLLEGSGGIAVSKFYGTVYEWRLEMENIIEIHFGDSKYSLGLQMADFVARHSYSWWKSGKDQNYPGWNYIESRLWRYPNQHGWGYKEFP